MTLAPITTHADDAEARLLEQYRSSPRLAGIVRDMATGAQGAEDAVWAMVTGRTLATAIGTTLDNVGALVGFSRQGLDDESYRAVLRGVVAENNTNSTSQVTLDILQALYQPQNGIFAHHSLPGGSIGFGLAAPAISPDLYPLMRRVFLRSLAGGVNLAFLSASAATAFSMAGPQPWVAGFGGESAPSVNLLAPNVATGGDSLGDATGWASCLSLEDFGAAGTDAVVGYVSTDATGDPSTAWQGAGAISVHTAGGARMGAKTTRGGLTPGLNYTFSYHAFNWGGFGAQAAPQIWSPGGMVDIIYQTGGTAISAFGWSRFTATFAQPAGQDAVELRVVEVTDSAYSWLLDGCQLEQAFSASSWVDPTPIIVTGGGLSAPI